MTCLFSIINLFNYLIMKMSRKDWYAIYQNDKVLANALKSNTGRNYTNCATQTLEMFYISYMSPKAPSPTKQSSCDSMLRLIEVLYNHRIILKKEVDYILGNK